MPATLPPFAAQPGAVATPALSDAACISILRQASDTSPALVGIFQLPALTLLYLNGTGRAMLDPEGRSALSEFVLPDLLGVSSLELLQSEMLVQANVLGKWTGYCTLRDVWGSELPVRATLTRHTAESATFLCFQAIHHFTPDASNPAATSDQELLRALMETLPDTVYFKDLHSRFLRVNRAMARKDNLSDPNDFIGKTDFDRFTLEHAQPAYDDEQRIIRTGEPILNLEEKETWPDGRVTWVSTSKFPLRDSDGRIVGTFGVSRDISAEKRAEAERCAMESKLQLGQKLESIGRLASGIAHEINTPTQFVTDNTRFLRDAFERLAAIVAAYRELRTAAAKHPPLASVVEAAAVAEQKHECDYILDEVPTTLQQSLDGLVRISRIVRSLKEFSHPNSAERSPADLNRAIETAIAVSRHEWKYVAEVVTEFDSSLPPVPCVLDEFNQVMLNLIINAAHAIGTALKQRGGDRGTITIRTRHTEKDAIIEVSDTGTGILPEHRDHIFEPFFTTKEPGKGTGQGLGIVHTVVVKRHDGSVDFTTTLGVGSTFRLTLPLVPPPAKTP
jgi:PAS domain S-box-containing protein